jgi:hypothetical protein
MAGEITYTTRRKDILETNRFASTVYSGGSGSGGGGVTDLTAYYTKTELQTSGSADVHWDNISNKPFVNVKDFGAVGNGITDDYAAIMTAIASLDTSSAMAGGGVVFFPKGIYLIRDEIEIHDAIGLTFIGIGELSIIHADGYNGRHFKFVDCTSIHLENMKLIGDTIDSSLSVGGIWFNLLNEDNNAYHVLRNLYITDITNTGVTMNTPILTVLENVVCRMCLGDSFFFYNGTSVTLTSCFALTSTECGFNFYQMTYCTMNSCAAEVNGVCYNFENSKAIVLNGCGAEDPIYRSATFPGYSYQTISGSYITAVGCYSRGADDVADPVNEDSGRFDMINFKDNDVAGISHITKLNTIAIDEGGIIGLNEDVELSLLDHAKGQIRQRYYTGNAGYRGNWTHDGYWGFGSTGSNNIVKIGSTDSVGVFTDDTFQLQVQGNALISDDVGSTGTFVSGFSGSGWRNVEASGEFTLTVDNLVVRKALTAYELDINKINSVNGGIIVSVANGTALTVSGTTIYFDEDGTSKQIQFQVNDYIRAQVWTGRGINSYVGLVTAVNHSATYGSANIVATTISGTPWDGMELVQIGNTTDAARQNLIYITASDTNNPYIDMLAGVNDGSFSGKQKLRIGNLTGITDDTYGALSGYGLWSENVYLTGWIKADSGYIGGFTINSTEGLYSGTGTTRVQMKAGAGFWCGATAIGDAPFSVNQAGYLKATSGLIGGWSIGSDYLETAASGQRIELSAGANEIAVYDDFDNYIKIVTEDSDLSSPAIKMMAGEFDTIIYPFGFQVQYYLLDPPTLKQFAVNLNSGTYLLLSIYGLPTTADVTPTGTWKTLYVDSGSGRVVKAV